MINWRPIAYEKTIKLAFNNEFNQISRNYGHGIKSVFSRRPLDWYSRGHQYLNS